MFGIGKIYLMFVLLITLTFTGCTSTEDSNLQSNVKNINSNEDGNETYIPYNLGEISNSSKSEKYNCSYNTYNCSDFLTHAEAQRVYTTCGGVNNDIHRLDRDKDGSACETLP